MVPIYGDPEVFFQILDTRKMENSLSLKSVFFHGGREIRTHDQTTHNSLSTTPLVNALVRWATTDKRLANRLLPRLTLTVTVTFPPRASTTVRVGGGRNFEHEHFQLTEVLN